VDLTFLELDESLLAIVKRSEISALRLEVLTVNTELAVLQERVDRTESDGARAKIVNDELAESLASMHREMEDLTTRISVTVTLNDDLAAQVDSIRRNDLPEAVAAVVDSLARLSQRVDRELRPMTMAAEKADFVYDHLTSRPYLSDPDRLRSTDASGREMIGFKSPWPADDPYVAFEDLFRGSEEMIGDRLRTYVELLRGMGPVVDLGCGRGELLSELATSHIDAIGVDSDPDMVTRAREKGVMVECADALEYISKQADNSLGVIASTQFVEHLTSEQLVSLLRLSLCKLKANGLFVAETVNPHSVRALKTFWTDLTHVHPLFPETLVSWCGLLGFATAEVHFPVSTGDLATDLRIQGEYAVVARKGVARPATESAGDPGPHISLAPGK
jgi:SAM-dependent methyltransferase